jgi:acetyltransferase
MLPENYPSEYIEEVTLKDGSKVLLRPIRPDDAPRLQHGFQHLSAQSIYLRFLESAKELSDAQAQAFATVDYQNRMAFVGSIQEDGQEHLVVSARYAMVGPQEPGTVEAAIVVRDDYQGRGLGLITLNHLVRYATKHGVTTLLATVHTSNTRIMQFIKRSKLPFDRIMLEPGVWEIRIHLSREP